MDHFLGKINIPTDMDTSNHHWKMGKKGTPNQTAFAPWSSTELRYFSQMVKHALSLRLENIPDPTKNVKVPPSIS